MKIHQVLSKMDPFICIDSKYDLILASDIIMIIKIF